MLVNASLSEAGLPISFFNGQYPDFTFEWYDDVGASLVQTMLINAFSPIIEFGVFYILGVMLRWKDRGFSNDTSKTKKKTIQQYVNLYSGPEYLLHYKYSTIMNIIFVTMMYGTGLPLLFPIALLSLVIYYVL